MLAAHGAEGGSHEMPIAAAVAQHSDVGIAIVPADIAHGTGRRRCVPLIVAAVVVVAAAVGAAATALSALAGEQGQASPSVTRTSGRATSSGQTMTAPGPPAASSAPESGERPASPGQTGPTSRVKPPEFLAGYGGTERVGYGNVKLGITLEDLLAAGDTAAVDVTPSGSTDYLLKAGGTATYPSMRAVSSHHFVRPDDYVEGRDGRRARHGSGPGLPRPGLRRVRRDGRPGR